MTEILEVGGRRGMRRFVEFPFELHADDPVWVPPLVRDELRILDAGKNPTFRHCRARYWLAIRDAHAVGRVAGFLNARENSQRGMKVMRFGFLDFVDDRSVAAALLDKVEQWAQEEGAARVEGPLGPGPFDRCAVLIEGFDRVPTAISSYNFPYYEGHIENSGYGKEIDYLEHRIRVPDRLNAREERVAAYVLRKKGLALWVPGNRRALFERRKEVFALVNEAYEGLRDFVPLTDGEIEFLLSRFLAAIDLEFIKIVTDAKGAIVAFGAAMESMSPGLRAARGKLLPFGWVRLLKAQKSNDVLDLYLVAVRRDLRNAGLHAILMKEMHRSALDAGLEWVETNGELEDNERVLSMWKGFDVETHKRRRIYRKVLTNGNGAIN